MRHDRGTAVAGPPALGQAPPPWVPITSRPWRGPLSIAQLSWAGASAPIMTVGVTKEPQRFAAGDVGVRCSPQLPCSRHRSSGVMHVFGALRPGACGPSDDQGLGACRGTCGDTCGGDFSRPQPSLVDCTGGFQTGSAGVPPACGPGARAPRNAPLPRPPGRCA